MKNVLLALFALTVLTFSILTQNLHVEQGDIVPDIISERFLVKNAVVVLTNLRVSNRTRLHMIYLDFQIVEKILGIVRDIWKYQLGIFGLILLSVPLYRRFSSFNHILLTFKVDWVVSVG